MIYCTCTTVYYLYIHNNECDVILFILSLLFSWQCYQNAYSVRRRWKKRNKKTFILWPTSWWHYLKCFLFYILYFSQLLVYKSIQRFTSLCIDKKSFIRITDGVMYVWVSVLYKYFAIAYYNAINETLRKTKLFNSNIRIVHYCNSTQHSTQWFSHCIITSERETQKHFTVTHCLYFLVIHSHSYVMVYRTMLCN